MKKHFIEILAILISFLIMSTVIAVPQAHSTTIMKNVKELEINDEYVNNILNINLIKKLKLDGIIELLIQLILLIIEFVSQLITIIQNIIGLVNLIQNLITALSTLFVLIQQLVELIQNIFNPQFIK